MSQPTNEQLLEWVYSLTYDGEDVEKLPPRPGSHFPHYYEPEHDQYLVAMCREILTMRRKAARAAQNSHSE